MRNLNFTRRQLIVGLGAAGVCSAASVEQLLSQPPKAPVRVLFVPLLHGWGISGTSKRSMSGTEDNFKFPAELAPFDSISQHSVIVDGLLTCGHWGNNHDVSYSDMLTAGVPNRAESSSFNAKMPLSVKPSLDYLLEKQSGKPAFRFSAGFQTHGTSYNAICFDDSGSGTFLPFFTKATDAYDSLFADIPAVPMAGPTPEMLRESQLAKSVFRFVESPAQRKLLTLGADEQQKLENYLTAVSEVEAKQANSLGFGGTERLARTPSGQGGVEQLADYLEMVRVGFANNMTTAAVVGIGEIEGIARFHADHAHSNSPTYYQSRGNLARYIVDFVNALERTPDVDGNTLLHNTVIILTGEIGDGEHNILNKGHIVFGGGGGQFKTGRWLKQPTVPGGSLVREDKSGQMQGIMTWGNMDAPCGVRTNADLLREVGNMAGLSLQEFGLPSQNKGSVLL